LSAVSADHTHHLLQTSNTFVFVSQCASSKCPVFVQFVKCIFNCNSDQSVNFTVIISYCFCNLYDFLH
jgi:hypothetical protein